MARRSVLFTPGDRPDMMRKAADSAADVLVFDLEDAVSPDRKAEARESIRTVLSSSTFNPSAEVCVRINPTGIAADEDLDVVLNGTAPDSLMLPKTSGVEDIETLRRLIREHDQRLPILAIIESAIGVQEVPAIAGATGTDAVVFGAEDLAADIGATRTSDGEEVVYARQRTVIAASAAGIDAIDTVYTDYRDIDGLVEDTRRAVEFGFQGKLAIHPDQVEPINDAFTPSDDEIEWATRVMDAQAEAMDAEQGVFGLDGEMIDAPLIAQAERILERAAAAEGNCTSNPD